jgi:hypothetical protein
MPAPYSRERAKNRYPCRHPRAEAHDRQSRFWSFWCYCGPLLSLLPVRRRDLARRRLVRFSHSRLPTRSASPCRHAQGAPIAWPIERPDVGGAKREAICANAAHRIPLDAGDMVSRRPFANRRPGQRASHIADQSGKIKAACSGSRKRNKRCRARRLRAIRRLSYRPDTQFRLASDARKAPGYGCESQYFNAADDIPPPRTQGRPTST